MNDDQATDPVEPTPAAAPTRELPPVAPPAPAAKRSPHEVLEAIEAEAKRFLGGRARSIERLVAELRSHL